MNQIVYQTIAVISKRTCVTGKQQRTLCLNGKDTMIMVCINIALQQGQTFSSLLESVLYIKIPPKGVGCGSYFSNRKLNFFHKYVTGISN